MFLQFERLLLLLLRPSLCRGACRRAKNRRGSSQSGGKAFHAQKWTGWFLGAAVLDPLPTMGELRVFFFFSALDCPAACTVCTARRRRLTPAPPTIAKTRPSQVWRELHGARGRDLLSYFVSAALQVDRLCTCFFLLFVVVVVCSCVGGWLSLWNGLEMTSWRCAHSLLLRFIVVLHRHALLSTYSVHLQTCATSSACDGSGCCVVMQRPVSRACGYVGLSGSQNVRACAPAGLRSCLGGLSDDYASGS